MELHIGRGMSRGSLTLFPIWNGASAPRQYAMDPSLLELSEREEGPTVPALSATNTGKRPVLVLEGQLFEGGWQHRMATTSALIAPQQRALIEVACVEQGRWAGGTRQHSRGRRATPYVRSGAVSGQGQGEVWRRVGQYVGADNATRSLVQQLDRSDHVALTDGLTPLPGQAGILIGLGGQPYIAEVFDDPRTLREQFDSIVAAAALDAPRAPEVSTPARRARRLIERFELLCMTEAGPAGVATRSEARSEYLDASAVRWQDRDLHLRITNVRHPLLAVPQ